MTAATTPAPSQDTAPTSPPGTSTPVARGVAEPELSSGLVAFLQGGRSCVVATIDPDGRPATTLMTWLVARSPDTLAVCVDTRSRAFRNLQERPGVAIELLGDDLVFGLKGRARVVRESMSTPPFPCALVLVSVDEVSDHGAPGVRFTGPSYAFEPGKGHRAELERAVFDELRQS